MRITGFYIDGFGIFHDCRLSGLSAGLNLFLGANEAGKSTLLAFFRQILLGFPTARNRFERQYPPMAGGRPGGALFLTLANGREIRIERRKGPHGGTVTITGPDGSLLPDMDISAITGGMGMELYRNIYAFSLNELQTIESLDSSDVKAVIYSAGMGTGLQRLPEAEKAIRTRKSSLFKPRGKKTRINALVKELDTVTHRLNQAMEENRQFEQLCHLSDRLKQDLEECKRKLADRRIEKARLQIVLSLSEPWSQLKTIRKKIQSIRDQAGQFPEQGLIRLESTESRMEEARRQLQEYRTMMEERCHELETLRPDTGLLTIRERIQGLFQRLPVFTAATERLSTEQARVAALEKQIHSLCQSLGDDWDVERINAIDRSMFTRDKIIEFRDRLKTAGDTVKQLEHSEQEKAELLGQADRAVEQARQKLNQSQCPVTPKELEELEQEYSEACTTSLQLQTITHQAQKLHRELDTSLARISTRWDRETAKDFDLSEASASWIRQQGNATHAAETEMQRAEEKVADISDRLDKAELAVKKGIIQREQVQKALGRLPFVHTGTDNTGNDHDAEMELPDPGLLWQNISELQETVSGLALVSEKLHNLRARLKETDSRLNQLTRNQSKAGSITAGAARFFFTASALFAAACPAVWYLSSIHSLMMKVPVEVVMAFLILLSGISLGAGFFELRRKKEGIRQQAMLFKQQLSHIQEERHRLASDEAQASEQNRVLGLKARELMKNLGVNPESDNPDTSDLDFMKSLVASLASDFQKFQRLYSRYHNISEQIVQHMDDVQRLGSELQRARDIAAQCREKAQDIQSRWKEFLETNRLDESVTPSDMNTMVAAVETCKRYLRELDQLTEAKKQAEGQLQAFYTRMEQTHDISGLSVTRPEASLQKIKRFLQDLSSMLHDQEMARQRLEAAEETRRDAAALVDECIKRLERANKEQARLLTTWEEWLRTNGFERDFRPDTLLDALGVMEQVLEKQADLDQARQELCSTKDTIQEYLKDSGEMFSLLNREPVGRDDMAHAVKLLNQELDAAITTESARNDLKKEIKRLKARIMVMESRMKELENDLSSLLSRAKVSDTEEFRNKHNLFSQLKRLETRAENIEESMAQIAAGHDLEELLDELEATGVEAITAAVQDTEDNIQELHKKIEDISVQTGEIRDRLSRLADSDELSRLMAEQERIRTEIADLCRRWSVLRVAEHMIDSAKNYFEKEKQPEVITRAGQFFNTITQGRYSGILCPPGSSELFAVTADGERISPEGLSRGTAEQLYLSLRFGYITCRQDAEKLPLLMDDILVNFDPERAMATARAINRLSEEIQVIFFTCHPETADIFRSAAMQNAHTLHLYQVQQGTISPVIKKPDAQTGTSLLTSTNMT